VARDLAVTFRATSELAIRGAYARPDGDRESFRGSDMNFDAAPPRFSP
jgi:hypothetical protein